MHNKTVLIVDDDTTLLNALEFNLLQAGYSVLTARDGHSAFNIALKEHPDIIISEVAVPVMDGIELCRKIKEMDDFKNVPFIFLTTHGRAEEKVKGFRAGADEYMVKPFDIEELMVRIEALHSRMNRVLQHEVPLTGSLSHLSLPEILQVLEYSQKTGRLILQTRKGEGYVSFGNGILFDAVFANMRGEDALVEMFPLREGQFRYEKGDVSDGSIMKSIGFTMVEIARLCDEKEVLKDLIPPRDVRFRVVKTPSEDDEESSLIIRLLAESPRNINELSRLSGLSITRVSLIVAGLIRDSLINPVEESKGGREMISRKDPIKLALWGMLDGNISSIGIHVALQGGEAIGRKLEGKDAMERLSEIDGRDNYEFLTINGLRLAMLRECPFAPLFKDIPQWSEKTKRLIEAFNRSGEGGGILHPLCLLHWGIRKAMKAGIVNIGCRESSTGNMEISDNALRKINIPREDAISMLETMACLFAIKK